MSSTSLRAPSVCLRLADEIDISRGDTLVHATPSPAWVATDAMVVWMSDTLLDTRRSYIKHTTQYVRTNVDAVSWRIDLETLEKEGGATELKLNDIGLVQFTTHRPLVFDAYRANRTTGAFIIIDSMTNVTVGAAMIVEPEDRDAVGAGIDLGTETQVSPKERAERAGHAGAVIGLVGVAGSGRGALAFSLERRLFDLGCSATVLDPRDRRHSDIPERAWPAVAHRERRLADAGALVIVSATCWASVSASASRVRGQRPLRRGPRGHRQALGGAGATPSCCCSGGPLRGPRVAGRHCSIEGESSTLRCPASAP